MENQATHRSVYHATNPTSSGATHDRALHRLSEAESERNREMEKARGREVEETERDYDRWKDDWCDLLVIRLVRSHRPYRISLTAVVISFEIWSPRRNVEEFAVVESASQTIPLHRKCRANAATLFFFLFFMPFSSLSPHQSIGVLRDSTTARDSLINERPRLWKSGFFFADAVV